MLAEIRELHALSIVHGNIQPKHFAVPMDFDPHKLYCCLYLIDFTQAIPFAYYTSDLPALFQVKASPNVYYSSIDMMGGHSAQRRDDLISWMYTVICLFTQLITFKF